MGKVDWGLFSHKMMEEGYDVLPEGKGIFVKTKMRNRLFQHIVFEPEGEDAVMSVTVEWFYPLVLPLAIFFLVIVPMFLFIHYSQYDMFANCVKNNVVEEGLDILGRLVCRWQQLLPGLSDTGDSSAGVVNREALKRVTLWPFFIWAVLLNFNILICYFFFKKKLARWLRSCAV